MNSFIYTVSQVNEYVRSLFSRDTILKKIYLRGEISNYKYHSSGHMYFSLKDDECLIRCVMFRQHNLGLGFTPRNGMEVIVKGYVSIYVRDGQYQFYSEGMEQDGLGTLHLAFEKMKLKLQQEGLFDEKHKVRLPLLPYKIGIITSYTGAALRDIIHIAHRRFFNINLLIVPVLVQGEKAANEIVHAIDYLNTREDIDIIITGRGGGSIEELWAFNEECVARSIFRSKIPVVSAVGHETDFTICDFAADRRAPTPSAAAELTVPDAPELRRKINNITGRLELILSQNVNLQRQKLRRLSERRVLTSPAAVIDEKRMMTLSAEQRLESNIKLILSRKKNDFIQYTSKLEALNPMSIITRGYSAVFREAGTLIKSVKQIEIGDDFYFKTSDGEVSGEVKEIRETVNG